MEPKPQIVELGLIVNAAFIIDGTAGGGAVSVPDPPSKRRA
jgi:hypothetical protein